MYLRKKNCRISLYLFPFFLDSIEGLSNGVLHVWLPFLGERKERSHCRVRAKERRHALPRTSWIEFY